MSLVIANDLVVSMQYTLTNAAGDVIDSSADGQPLEYLHGANNIIPGLEDELTGKKQGDSLQVTVTPENGYGSIEPSLIQEVPLEMFQGVDQVEPGMAFQSQGPDGEVMMVTVTKVENEQVTIDGNHPLAGQTLTFDVTIDAVREATDDEKQHGHIHSESCSH